MRAPLALMEFTFVKGENNLSHIVQIKTEIRSEAAVQAACKKLHLPPAKNGTFELYNSTETGLGIELPRWRYPIVANLESGDLRFDHYEGRWGDREYLDQFLQRYCVEAATIAARKEGHSVNAVSYTHLTLPTKA